MANKKDWREEYKEKNPQEESEKSNWRDKYKEYYDYNSAKIVGEKVTSMLEDWQKNYNSYVTDYTNRFSKRKGSYEDAYVGDSLEWMNAETEKRSALKKQEDDILAYLNQYGGHLDSKWVKEVFDYINQAKDAQYKIHSGATKDNDYWAKFTPNEDQAAAGYTAEKLYNEWQSEQNQYAEDMAFDIYSGEVDLEILKHEKAMYLKEQQEKRKQAQENESWMDKVGRWLGTTPDTSLPLGGASAGSSSQSSTKYDSQIAALEEQINRAKYVQGYEGFMDNMDAEDYAANSHYASTRTDVAMEDAMWGFGNTQYDTSKLFGDFMYDYINRNEDALNAGMVNDTATDAYFLGFDKGFLKTMTDDEIGVYNYLYKTQGQESANAFLSHIESDLEGRRRAQEQAFWASYAKSDPVGSSVFSTLISPLKGMSYLGQAADMLDDGKMEENAGYNRFSYIPSTIRSQVSTTIEKSGKWGKVGSFAYNTGMSMADFLFTTAVSGGNQALSLAIMGSGAAADATLAAKDRGLDDAQAFTLGTIAGLAEVAMEKISLGAWLEGDMTEGALRYMLKNALSEGGEEAGTSVINLLADVIIAGDKSEWNMAMQAYIDQGKSEAEAFGLVLAENAAQIGLDALGGILSGAAIGGGTYAGASIGAGFQYGDIGKDKAQAQQLVTEGLELNPTSQYVQKAQSKLDKGKNLTGMQVRNILAANQEQVTANDMKKIQKAAEKRLTDLGQTKDVSKLAEIATKLATGQEITRAEKRLLTHSEYGAQVAKEMRDSVAQEEKATYKPLEKRVEAEKPAKVSDTGKTVVRATDDEIDLKSIKVKEISEDSVVLDVNGKDVDISDVDFATEELGNAFNALKKVEHITPTVASDMIAKIDTSKPIWGQMNGMDEAFTYGYWNYSEADLKAGLFASNLTKEQLNDAYKLGQYVRKHDVEADETNRKKMRTAFEAKMSKKEQAAQQKARIESDDVDVYFMDGETVEKFGDREGYNEKRMAAVNTAKFLRKLGIGGKFVFYESYEKNGKRYFKDKNGVERSAPNGFYDPADGSIYIDLNAGNDGSGKALFTMGHELAHFVKHRSEKQFKILSDMVAEAFDKTSLSMHKRVLRKQAFLQGVRGNTEKVSYSEAYEEVVADAMSTMLTDGSFYDTLMEIKVKHKDLFVTIKKFFTDMIAKFKQEYANIDPDQQDAIDIRELKNAFDKIQRVFAEGLVEASENFQAEQTQKNTTEEGDVKYEIREIGNTGKFYVQADRQVLTGDDPSLWGKQIENYINEQIRKEQDMAIPTSDGHILLLTRRSAYKLSDQAVSSIGSKIRNMLSSENFALKGRAATHIDELIQVARYEDYKADEDGKHENDIGEDGFTYYYAFFRDFDGQYYRIPFSAGVNAQEETAYSIGKITKRRLPAGLGSSSNEALENGRKPSGAIIYSSEAKSQEVKTALQLAYEKALKQKGDKAEASQEATATNEVGMEVDAKTESVAPAVLKSERDMVKQDRAYLDAVNRGDIETAQKMVDEAAREWSEGNEIYTTDPETGEVLLKFYRSADGGRTVWNGHGNNQNQGVFLTSDPYIADAFDVSLGIPKGQQGGQHITVYAKAENPFVIDANGRGYTSIPIEENSVPNWLYEASSSDVEWSDEANDYVTVDYIDIDNLFPAAFKQGHDAVIVTNVVEGVGGGLATDVVLKDGGKQMKSADPVTYDDNGNVIPLSQRFNTENDDIRYSERDSSGSQLSKEQQEFFKDSKIVDANGNLKVMYHGSKESFAVFDKKKARSSGYYGKGFYFTDSVSHAKQYGNTYEVYLNITNPLQDGTNDITKEQLRKFVEAIAENEDYGLDNYGEIATVDSVTNSVYGKGDFAMLMDINASCVGDLVAAVELFNEVNGTDYDGIIAPTETVAFYPEQIKRTDNKTPTSNPDMRYSERNTETDQTDIYSRIFDLQSEEGRLNRSIKEIEDSEDFKSVQDRMFNADSVEAGVNQYLEWKEKSGYGALLAQRDSVRDELKKLREERDNNYADESAEKERQAIAKSGLSEAEYFRKQAVNEFGYTPYFYDAGYLTPNGKMLNFSGEKGKHFGSRGEDHRAIGIIYENTQGSDAMVRFMNDGNIRIMAETPGLDISSLVEPTKEQYAQIRKFARENGSKEQYFAVDISDENGRVIGNYEYDGYVNADRVVNDIKYFFENGEVREQSSVARFLNSERGEDSSNRSLLANAFEGITRDSIEYKMIQEYKGHIKDLNALDKELGKINAEIREIRFTKGKYDAKKLSALEGKAKAIANEITRHDRELLSLEASEPLRKVLQRERKKEAQKTKEHVNEILQNKKVRAEQTELRNKIRKTIRDLDKILNRGNKKQNVKEDLQPVVTKALRAAEILFTDNYNTYDMLRNGLCVDLSDSEEALVDSCTKMLKDLDKMPTDGYDSWQARQEAESRLDAKMSKLREVFARERKRLNNTTVSSILGELADAYASLEKSEQSYVQGAYIEAVHDFLKNLQSEVGGTIVMDMTKDQLESVYAAYKMVLTTVHKANQLFNQNLKMSREQLGNAVIEEVLKAGGVHLIGTKAGDAVNQFSWNNMKPVWVANRIGSESFAKLMQGLFDGQYNFARDIDEVKQFKLSMDEKYKPRNWDVKKQYDFESYTGKKFSLNLQQIMSLYAFSKREQAYSHLLNGGFVFEENSTVVVDGKLGIKRTYIHKGAASYKLNEATLNGIINSLTADQKAYVDEMQAFLSDVMGAKGNEVSMQLYGIQMFKEKFYFPLRSSGAYMERAKEAELKKQQGQINLVNSGFTHSVKPEAKNPIVLSGFMDVWAEHCNEMSMYHAMVLPMEDFRKVYNYSTIHDEKMESASVYQTIQDAYGKAATNYIDQLYRELNAGATVDPTETPWKKLISNFKKAAVMLSGSVWVQQFSSIGRAYAVIDPKYFTGAKVNSDTNLSVAEEMKKYAPVAILKEMGGFDTSTRGNAKSYIVAEKYGKGEFFKGLKDEQYRNDIMGMLPAKADEQTWCAIWEACKRETKAKNPKMDVKSEEFLKLAGERFSEVIEKTQVYDSVLARSANMRSKGNFMAMATAFMAEPTTTINLIEDAIRSGKAKNIARAFGSVAVTIVLNNALASIVYAMRDDDDDETFLEKYFQSFASGMIDDINPMSYYPFLKDVWSLFQGYDVERTDMAVIADVRDAMKQVYKYLSEDTSEMDDKKLAEHNKNLWGAFMSLLDAGCSAFGVPFKNIRRDVNGLINAWNTVSKDLSGERDNSWLSFWDKVGAAAKDTIPFLAWTKDAPKTYKLYEAIVSGDKAYIDRLKAGYVDKDGNFDQSKYDSAVVKALRENDPRIKAAAQANVNGNAGERNRILNEIKAEGKFSASYIIDAINAETSAIRNKGKPDKVAGQYEAYDFVEAVSAGDANTAKAVREDIISTYVANGKTQTQAENSFVSDVKTGIEEAYSYGDISKDVAKDMLIDYADMDEEDAADKITIWDFLNANPDSNLSDSKVLKYLEFAEPAHVSLEVYEQFINDTADLKDIKDKWGDVEVTTREQVLEVIDSLPLSWQQKDALYLAYGYKESTIWDVPW